MAGGAAGVGVEVCAVVAFEEGGYCGGSVRCVGKWLRRGGEGGGVRSLCGETDASCF